MAELVTSVVAADDGGYLLSGISSSNISGDKSENSIGDDDFETDYWVVKTDRLGKKEWDKTLGGLDFDNSASAVVTPAGGYLLAGHSRSNAFADKSEDSKGGYDYWIVELKTPSAPVATSFTLINAHTDQEIKELKDGDVVNLTEVGSRLLDIRANITAENISKVTLDLTGPITHHQTELLSPYALFGNIQDDFNGRKLLPGTYTLTVMPYINEKEGTVVNISFTVINGITLTLMNAHTDQEIKELNDGDSIHLAEIGTRFLDVRCQYDCQRDRYVVFSLKGPVTHYQIERVPPYALFGNNKDDFSGRKLLPGTYTLTVAPYAYNTKVTELTISFVVTDGFAISGFTLIDATLDKPVGTLSQGDVIDLSLFKGHKLSVRVEGHLRHLDKVDLSCKVL